MGGSALQEETVGYRLQVIAIRSMFNLLTSFLDASITRHTLRFEKAVMDLPSGCEANEAC
jgi:hypothetical protein